MLFASSLSSSSSSSFAARFLSGSLLLRNYFRIRKWYLEGEVKKDLLLTLGIIILILVCLVVSMSAPSFPESLALTDVVGA